MRYETDDEGFVAAPDGRRALLAAMAGLPALLVMPAAVGRNLATGSAVETQRRHLFGSPAELLLPVRADTAVPDTAPLWRSLTAMNARWNAWKPGDVHDVNQAIAAGRSVEPAPGVCRLIRISAALERVSMGFFNAGIGGLVGAWGFHQDRLSPGRPPSPRQLARWRDAAPSLHQLQWRGQTVCSSNPRVQLDFGAVAKGVAIDVCLDRLAASGAPGAVLNLGGNLAGFGDVHGRPWRIGVRDPLGPGVMATLALRGREAVVTSGSYERFRWVDGRRETHIIEPALGQPAPDQIGRAHV